MSISTCFFIELNLVKAARKDGFESPLKLPLYSLNYFRYSFYSVMKITCFKFVKAVGSAPSKTVYKKAKCL
jgi:hypothetical protein